MRVVEVRAVRNRAFPEVQGGYQMDPRAIGTRLLSSEAVLAVYFELPLFASRLCWEFSPCRHFVETGAVEVPLTLQGALEFCSRLLTLSAHLRVGESLVVN